MFSVYKKAMRDSRKTILWLSVGLAIYALFVMAFYPTLKNQQEQLNDFIENYPDEMIALFYGSQDVDEVDLAEPGGFIHAQFALWAVLILGGVVIVQAFNAITNAERDNSLDLMLSLPISRRHYLIGRLLASLTGVLMVLTVSWGAFALATFIWEEFDITLGELAGAMYGAFFPLAVVATFSYMLASMIPSSKKYAGAVAYLFLFGSYLLNSFAAIVDSLARVDDFFIFHYYNAGTIVRQGISLADWGLLTVVALVCFAVAWVLIDRKELGV